MIRLLHFLTTVVLISLILETIEGLSLNKNTKLVVFSFDGFRHDYLTFANTPTLNSLKANGVTTPYMIPQFTTKTFPNHMSIVTGLYAENHGIVDNAVFDPEHNRTISGYDDHREFWVYSEKSVPIWILNEMAGDGRCSGAQFPGSTQPYGENEKTITHMLGYNGSLPYKDRMDIVVNWLTNDTNPANLAFMYFEEPDKQGHAYGPNSPEVKAAVENLDKMTAYFIERLQDLGIYDQVNIIILSDHGMEEVNLKNQIVLEDLIDQKFKYRKLGGSPLLHIWPNDESQTEEMYQQFLAASLTKPFTVYKKDEAPEHWKYSHNRRVAPILLISDRGFIFNDRRPDKNNSKTSHQVQSDRTDKFVGYHGYDNSIDGDMRAFFLAHGPDFEKGIYIEPFENVDLFPFMCQLLGFNPPPNNGTLGRVTPALLKQTDSSATNQNPSKLYYYILGTAAVFQILMSHFY